MTDTDKMFMYNFPLEKLNSRYAIYGSGDNTLRIDREVYEALGRPSRLNVYLDREW